MNILHGPDSQVFKLANCDSQLLGSRLRLIRIEVLGVHSVGEVARAAGVPPGTWTNYESGVAIPGHILLRFLELVRVEPSWLLSGQGARYRTAPVKPRSA